MKVFSVVVVVVVVVVAAACHSTMARPLTPVDLTEMQKVGTPVVNPTGDHVLFSVGVWEGMENGGNQHTRNLHIASVSEPHNSTCINPRSLVQDTEYVWTPDSRYIIFLSNRDTDGITQLFVYDTSSTNATQISNFPISVANLKIDPLGTRLGFSAQVYPGYTMEGTAELDYEKSISPIDSQEWDEWWEGKYNHIFIVDLNFDSLTGFPRISSPVDIMELFYGDCPSRPFGGTEEYDFSYDGTEVAFTTQLGDDIAWSTDLNVWVYGISRKEYTCMTSKNPATDTQPKYSPNNLYLAYLGMDIPQYEFDRMRIRLINRLNGEVHDITEHTLDRSPSHMVWSEDSSKIYVLVNDEARMRIYTVDIATGLPTIVVTDGYNSNINLIPCDDDSSTTCILFSRSTLQRPADLFVTKQHGMDTQLTWFNQPLLDELELSEPFEFYYNSPNGDQIQSWILKPYGYSTDKSYPVVLYIHGGPEGAWNDMWHYRWNPQTISARGFAVFSLNIHGSESFGSAFREAILCNWGGLPYEDIMAGMEAAGNVFSWMDMNTVGAMGASYGGYMINWINSHTTRFKCLICHDGLFDVLGWYYYDDDLFFVEHEFCGTPYENLTNYIRWNPMIYATKAVTPQLTFHGGEDYRVPEVQGIAAFTSLQRRGIRSRFIRFPHEDHWIMKEPNSIYWHEAIFDWLDEYLNTSALLSPNSSSTTDSSPATCAFVSTSMIILTLCFALLYYNQ